jgi:nickel-dependent lactate racemase
LRIKVAFGKSGLNLDLPAGPEYTILETRRGVALDNVTEALNRALDNPIAAPALTELARGKRTAAIAVCDITRPAPNSITLPPLLERLHYAGISQENIKILIATGLHRAATPEEITAIVGSGIASRYAVENHNAKSFDSHVSMGRTKRGTPIYVDRRFVEADLHITLGFIEQHLMAGFSGGRKLIVPGLAAQETIKVLHSPAFMRQPEATEGSFEKNPLHAELLEIASAVRHDFMLDVTLTRDREIGGVFAGHAIEAHEAGVQFFRETLLESFSEPFDAVITTAAGYPLDLTFYQTIKGVTAAQHIVKPGGAILVLGECGEGIGAAEFARKVANLSTYQEYLRSLDGVPVEVDQWQLEKLALVAANHEVLFYTPGILYEKTGGISPRIFETPTDAIKQLLRCLPQRSRIAVIPEGPYVFAKVMQPTAA